MRFASSCFVGEVHASRGKPFVSEDLSGLADRFAKQPLSQWNRFELLWHVRASHSLTTTLGERIDLEELEEHRYRIHVRGANGITRMEGTMKISEGDDYLVVAASRAQGSAHFYWVHCESARASL
jgi:hypothetical protein